MSLNIVTYADDVIFSFEQTKKHENKNNFKLNYNILYCDQDTFTVELYITKYKFYIKENKRNHSREVKYKYFEKITSTTYFKVFYDCFSKKWLILKLWTNEV